MVGEVVTARVLLSRVLLNSWSLRARFVHFKDSDVILNHRNIEGYFKTLDNSYLETSQLQKTKELLETSLLDQQFKMNFWNKFITVSQSLGHYKILSSLTHFVLQNSRDHSISTLITILKVLATEERFQEFESLYAVLKSRLSFAESVAYSGEISSALFRTPFYAEAAVFLKLCLKSRLPVTSFARILSGAARFGSLDEAISLVNEFHPLKLIPDDEFYSVFINRLSDDEGMRYMLSLLDMVSQLKYILPNSSALQIKEWFERHGWRGTMGVNLSGVCCNACDTKLSRANFDTETCTRLAENFYNYVLKGKNDDELFLTTFPKELESFHTFIEASAQPFDCIIDLPNFLHFFKHRHSKGATQDQIQNISDLILILHRRYQFKRFCLVGKERSVVKKKAFWDTVKAMGNKTGIHVGTFLTDHKSDDDAFMIYLALWSGPDCHLLSNDEFRQHRFTLGPENGAVMAQWQTIRQISIRSTHPFNFTDPVKCDTRVQGSMAEGWHIPYESGVPRHSYLPTNTWLCLRPSQKTWPLTTAR